MLTFEGEFCADSVQWAAPRIERWFAEAACRAALLDMSGVSFIDGRGLSLMLSLPHLGDIHGVPLMVSADLMSGCVQRLLTICGLTVRESTLAPIDGTAHPGPSATGVDANRPPSLLSALTSDEGRALTRMLLDGLPGASISVLDRELRHVMVEGQAIRLAGHDPRTWEGRSVADVTESDAEHFIENAQLALTGMPFTHEHENNGHVFLSRGTPLRDRSGNVEAVLVVSTDITDHWSMGESARAKARNLEIAMQSRAEIEQAKGILMMQLGIGADEAFDLLKQQSQHENLKLRDLARETIRLSMGKQARP